MAQSFKRRNYFIDKQAQGRFIAGFVAASLIGGAAAVFCFRYLALKKIDATLYTMRLPDVPMGALLIEEMFITTALTAFLVILLFAFTARKIFARIDGPLKKMAASVGRITEGDVISEVKLRENDEFQEFARELNGVAQVMRSRFTAIKERADKMSGLSQKSEGASVQEIRSEIAALKKEMRVFKL